MLFTKIISYNEIDSTNSEANRLLGKKEIESGTVILAEKQSSGKGQGNKNWESPAGNLYFSFILKPCFELSFSFFFVFFPALAIYDFLRKEFSLEIALKWPNDIFYGATKLGGILIEASVTEKKYNHVIIGIGINLNKDPEIRSAENNELLSISLNKITGFRVNIEQFFKGLLKELEKSYNFYQKDFALMQEKVNSILYKRGRFVKISSNKTVFTGIIEGIDKNGFLELRTNEDRIIKISSGSLS